MQRRKGTYYDQNRERQLRISKQRYYQRRGEVLERQIAEQSERDSFWSRVAIGALGTCWLWQRQRSRKGYGKTNDGERAHRVAWALAHQRQVPEGLLVMHTCDNPPCCNPRHLYVGTHRDNMHDVVVRGRQRGERNNNCRLQPKDVRALRASDVPAAGAGRWEVLEGIGARFGISASHVNNILRRRFWKNLT